MLIKSAQIRIVLVTCTLAGSAIKKQHPRVVIEQNTKPSIIFGQRASMTSMNSHTLWSDIYATKCVRTEQLEVSAGGLGKGRDSEVASKETSGLQSN